MTECIHFAHGNGLPALSYSQLLNNLATRYQCFYLDRIGHNPRFPVTENWNFLVDEILANIKKHSNQPIIALGHSLGGVLSLIAAIKQPNLFKTVIIVDAPLLGNLKSTIVKFAKMLGLIDHITPAARTRQRREFWHSKDEIHQYLKGRDLFKTFSPACLQDYINYGFKKVANGYVLYFDRNIEYLIFRTIPHTLHEYKGQLKVPSTLIYGDKSNIVSTSDVKYMQKHYGVEAVKMSGTHMLPMESPDKLAREIFKILDSI